MNKSERQKLCIQRWLNNKGIGIFELATGFGKTRTAILGIKLLLSQNPEAKILISVPSDVLQKQWKNILEKYKIKAEVLIINTIVKNEYEVDLLVIDEIHATLSNEFINIYKKVKFKFFIGLTGTLNRLDGREKHLIKKIPVVDKITVEEAIENDWLSNYRDYKVLIDVDLSEYYKYNQLFISTFSMFNYDFKLAMNCMSDIVYCNKHAKFLGIPSSELRQNAMIWGQMLRKRKAFVQSHPKKFELANLIIKHRSNKKIVTFSATIEDTKKINSGLLLNSKITKSKNKITIEEFNKLETGILNTSKSVDCGMDIEGLSVAIIISGNSSKIQKNQRLKA